MVLESGFPPDLKAVRIALTILQDDHEKAAPLFELLKEVVDPNGDPARYSIADEVMKRIIVFTPQFEEWYRSQVA